MSASRRARGTPVDAGVVNERVLSDSERRQRPELMRLLGELSCGRKPKEGMVQLVERAAYTWFNRLFAIRFTEANDRLPSHVCMLSAPDGSFEPKCLREAMDLPLEGLDAVRVVNLVTACFDEGLFPRPQSSGSGFILRQPLLHLLLYVYFFSTAMLTL